MSCSRRTCTLLLTNLLVVLTAHISWWKAILLKVHIESNYIWLIYLLAIVGCITLIVERAASNNFSKCTICFPYAYMHTTSTRIFVWFHFIASAKLHFSLLCFVHLYFFHEKSKYDLWTDEICVSDVTSECNMLSLHNFDYVTTHTRGLMILAVVRWQMCLSSRQIDLNVMNECWCNMKMNWMKRIKQHVWSFKSIQLNDWDVDGVAVLKSCTHHKSCQTFSATFSSTEDVNKLFGASML